MKGEGREKKKERRRRRRAELKPVGSESVNTGDEARGADGGAEEERRQVTGGESTTDTQAAPQGLLGKTHQ